MDKIINIKYYVSMLMLFTFLVSCKAGDKNLPSISAEQLQTKLNADSNLVLLDVRTVGEFNGPLGHIEGAILIPVNELSARIDELDKYKDDEIMVYCRSGNRSRVATDYLLQNGYNAVNILGGIKAWNKLHNK
ncbi:MAG: rhodanese-like domain-containing protein [Calditrichaceae bacterium]|jgi:rhodanese-related sulfurtransferase